MTTIHLTLTTFLSVERIQYFHDAIQDKEEPLSDTQLAELILKYGIYSRFSL